MPGDFSVEALTPEQRAALDAVVDGDWLWVADAAVVGTALARSEAGAAVVAGLVELGWLARWTLDVEVLTLTPMAAWALGVVPVEDWGVPSWEHAPRDEQGDPVALPRQERLPRHPAEKMIRYLDILAVDPSPGPLEACIEAEEAFLMREQVREDGRPVRDEETGLPVVVPVELWGRTVPIDPRLGRRGRRKGRAAEPARSRSRAG